MTVHRSSLRYLLVIGVVLSVGIACNWFEEHEYVKVLVINRTGEDLVVQTGLDFVTQTVLKDSSITVVVVVGASISARGKTTDERYGPMMFWQDSNWIIYPT